MIPNHGLHIRFSATIVKNMRGQKIFLFKGAVVGLVGNTIITSSYRRGSSATHRLLALLSPRAADPEGSKPLRCK